MNHNIPVYLLSGFLGSGKTTLLKNLLQYEKKSGRKPAVLMNEAGKVSIDSEEVDRDVPLAELLDGCICCTIQDKLESQLQQLLFDGGFDTLIIETTGVAHPVEVVDSVLSPLFADRFEFKGILTTVDVMQWESRENLSVQALQLLREQIRFSSLVLLNKIDLISESRIPFILNELQSITSSKILMTQHAKINFAELESISTVDYDGASNIRADKELNLNVLVHTFSNPVERTLFEDWMRKVSSTVYRMKGFVPFKNEKYPSLVQYSYGMPLYFEQDMKMPPNFVVIGENLNVEQISKELERLEL
ncbi:cobalamin biosynthesis protein [Jeotgalibacillus alimentarius]|uniref:Cobalamin biosynthesis protein n=1 Tax=Jeotgalibacillus alimentarius TaxID=135826 RepID=A0A0C2VIY9_9BACL|nr:GTP-binding protein [Jeotgalibacillus alimentarius]KIL48852.1 cobalamin biosynthesis protein [Jeotgalibacillus alimentarius]